jgi:hypothetical protein
MTIGTDDTSVVALGDEDIFVGWGDWRPGNVAGYFSAVKLTAFRDHGAATFPSQSGGYDWQHDRCERGR